MRSLISIVLLFSIVVTGCGRDSEPSPEAKTTDKPVVEKTTSAENEESSDENSNQQATTSRSDDSATNQTKASANSSTARIEPESGTSQTKVTLPAADLSYITDDFVAALLIRPQRVIESKFATKLIDLAIGRDEFDTQVKEISSNVGFDPQTIAQVAFLLDGENIGSAAGIPGSGGPSRQQIAYKNQFKMIGVAFHNFHDAHRKFPRHDGPPVIAGRFKRGLSWRVHLLPFLEHFDLYTQFKLDEPWDSEHNKALIKLMPDVFKTPGIKEAGKTSIHVFVGKDTPFADDTAPSLRDYIDGTSNTFLAVAAGLDKAEIWTKPGGLKFNADDPRAELGKIPEDGFMALFADGFVQKMVTETDNETLSRLIRHQDGQAVDRDLYSKPHDSGRQILKMPAFVAHLTADIDAERLLSAMSEEIGEATEKTHGDLKYHLMRGYAVCLPNKRTAVAAREELLLKMLDAKPAESPLTTQLASIETSGDVVVAVNLKPLQPMLATLLERAPMLGVATQIDTVSASLSVSGSPGDSMFRIEVTAKDEAAARQLEGMLNVVVANFKQQLEMLAQQPQFPQIVPVELFDLGKKLFDSAMLKQDTTQVVLNIAISEDFNAMIDSMEPQFKQLGETIKRARKAAKQSERRNNMKEILLALLNYHDVHQMFPRANGPAMVAPTKKLYLGLSWRVHILPLLGEVELHEKFNFDEPWDSKHNKALIAQMPKVFQTPGVEDSGKTAIHVFLGEGTPFGDGSVTPRLRDFTDGTTNSLLAVMAGPATAEVWTKPGGLKFDAKNAKSVLGKVNESFLFGFADGHVRFVTPDVITDELLRRLVYHQDGKPIPEF